MLSSSPRRPADSHATHSPFRWKRLIAGIASAALTIGGLTLSPLVGSATEAKADTVLPDFGSGNVLKPGWKKLDDLQIIWLHELTENSIYWTSDATNGRPGGTNTDNSVKAKHTQFAVGESYDFSDDGLTYKTRTAALFFATQSNSIWAKYSTAWYQFSTMAIGRTGGKANNPGDPLTMYFWSWDDDSSNNDLINQSLFNCSDITGKSASSYATAVRVTYGSPDVWVGCMPTSRAHGMDPNGGYAKQNRAFVYEDGGSAVGGEMDQLTGYVYAQDYQDDVDEIGPTAYGANVSVTGNSGWFQFLIWDPVTGKFARSGYIQPADWQPYGRGDISGNGLSQERAALYQCSDDRSKTCASPQTSADFGLDAKGNIYMFAGSATTASSSGSSNLIRITPVKDKNGNYIDGSYENPWRYSVVKKLTKTGGSTPGVYWTDTTGSTNLAVQKMWGAGIHNGQFFIGGGWTALGVPSGMPAGYKNGTPAQMLKIDPMSGVMELIGSTENETLGVAYDTADKAGLFTKATQDSGNGTAPNAFITGSNQAGFATNTTNGGVWSTVSPATDTAGTNGNHWRDDASAQELNTVQGTIYNDVNGNGIAEDNELGIPGITVAIYDSAQKLLGVETTDSLGQYSFIVSQLATYYLRVVQPTINSTNAVQTWASADSTDNVTTPACLVSGDLNSNGQQMCSGNLSVPYTDPNLDALGTTGSSSTWPIYSQIAMSSYLEIAQADFGITVAGSYGDSISGPTGVSVGAPVHVFGAIADPLWLGKESGFYPGPSMDSTAHNSSDDGVYFRSCLATDAKGNPVACDGAIYPYNKVPLNFVDETTKAVTGPTLASTKEYTLEATLNGRDASPSAYVRGWTSEVGTAGSMTPMAWQTTAKWVPTVDSTGSTASGLFRYGTSALTNKTAQVQFRVDASTTEAKAPTSGSGNYQSTSSMNRWTTAGEIEDYALNLADSVYHYAVKTSGGEAIVNVPATATDSQNAASLKVSSDNYSFGPLVSAAAGQQLSTTIKMPNADWTVNTVRLRDAVSGDLIDPQPTVSTSGLVTTIRWTPKLGEDVSVEVIIGKSPDPVQSQLTLNPTNGTAGIGDTVTARATVKAKDGSLLSGQTVNFALDPTTAPTFEDSTQTTTCVTNIDGYCEVKVTSTQSTAPGETGQLSAKLGENAITGSPATVKFTGVPNAKNSELHVTGAGLKADDPLVLTVGTDAANTFTATTTVKDNGTPVANLLPGQEVTYTVTRASATSPSTGAVDSSKTHFGATGTSTTAKCTTSANLDTTYGTCSQQLVSTESGDFKIWATVKEAGTDTDVTYSPVTVSYTADPVPSELTSTLVVTPAAADRPIAVNSYYTATVTAKDKYSNVILSGADFSFTASGNAGNTVSFRDGKATCTTGDDGTCTVAVTDSKAETLSLSSTVKVAGADKPVLNSPATGLSFAPGPPGATLNVPSTDQVAGQRVTASISVLDSDQNPIENKKVTLTLSGDATFDLTKIAKDAGARVQTKDCTTNNLGVCTIDFTDPTAESITVTMTVDGIPANELLGTPATVKFVGDKDHPSRDKSTLTTSPSGVKAGENLTGTATVKDQYDNLLDGVTVTFGATKSGTFGSVDDDPVSTKTCTTVAGVCTATLTDKVSESVAFSAKIKENPTDAAPVDITNSPKTIVFGGLPAYSASWTVTKTSTNSDNTKDPMANGVESWTGTITAKDSFGGLVPDTPVASFDISANSDNVTVSPVVNNGDGTYTVKFTSEKANTDFSVSGTVATAANPALPFDVPNATTIRFRSGGASSVVVAVAPTDPTAGQKVTATVTAKDKNGDPVPNETITVSVPANSSATTGTGSAKTATCTTDSTGVCKVDITDTKAETFEVNAESSSGTQADPVSVTYTADPTPDATKSHVTVSPAKQAAGSDIGVTVSLRDKYDNPILHTAGSDFVMTAVSSDTAKAPSLTSSDFRAFNEGSDGNYTFQVTSKPAGTFTLNATVKTVLLTDKPSMEFTPAAPCTTGSEVSELAKKTRYEVTTNDQPVDGTSQDVATVHIFDCYGNAVSGASIEAKDATKTPVELVGALTPQTVTATSALDGTAQLKWTSLKVGSYAVTVTVGTEKLAIPESSAGAGDIRFSQIGGDAGDPAKSGLVITPAGPLEVSSNYTATVTAHDSNGNLAKNTIVKFSSDNSDVTFSNATCRTFDDGTCSVTFTSTVVGVKTIHAKMPKNGNDVDVAGNGKPAEASPQSVSFIAGPPCNPNDPNDKCDPRPDHQTRIEITNNNAQANGTDTDEITFYAFDAFGNPVPSVKPSVGSVTGLTFLSASATTAADGSALLKFTSTTKTGTNPYSVPVSLGSVQVLNSPALLAFGGGVPATMTLAIDPTTAQSVGSPFVLTATMKDAQGNLVDAGVAANVVLPNGVTVVGGGSPTCVTDSAAGTCSISVTSNVAGTYTISGTAGSVKSNGVTATFIAGEVDPTISWIEITKVGAANDGVATDAITIHALDKDGNPVPGAVFTSEPWNPAAEDPKYGVSTLKVSGTISPTDSNGQTQVYYTSENVGTFHAAVKFNGVEISGQKPAGVSNPGGPSPAVLSFSGDIIGVAANSKFEIAPAGPLVVGEGPDSQYTLKATINDADNKPAANQVVSFTVSPTGPTWGASGMTCMTDGSGQCSVTVTSTKASTFAFSASIIDAISKASKALADGQPQTRIWISDDVCAKGCDPVPDDPSLWTRVEVTTNNSTANGSTPDVATFYAFDKWGNPVANIKANTTPADPTKLTVVTPTVTTNGVDGSPDYGTAKIQFTSRVATCPPNPAYDGCPALHEASVTLTSRDGDSVELNDAIVKLGFKSGSDVSVTKSTLTMSSTTPTVGDPVTATLKAVDNDGNPVAGVQATFGSTGDSKLSATTCTTAANGTCQVTVTDETTETIQVSGKLKGTDVAGSPASVTYGPGQVDPTLSELKIDNSNGVPVGTGHHTVTVTLKDKYGNTIKNPKDVVTFQPASPATTTTAVNKGDGTYTADISSTKIGSFNVTAQVGGKPVGPAGAQTVVVAVFTTDPVPGKSTLDVEPKIPVEAGTNVTVTATVLDGYGNLVPNTTVTLKSTGSGTLSAPTCTTDSTGKCSVTATDKVTETITISGTVNGQPMANTVNATFKNACIQGDPACPIPPDTLNRNYVELTKNGQNAAVSGQANEVTVHIFDILGNPALDQPVTSVPDSSAVTVGAIAPTNSNGVSVIKYTMNDQAGGEVIATVMVNGREIKFDPSPLDPISYTAEQIAAKSSPVTMRFSDATAPGAPSISQPANGAVTNQATPTFAGKGEPGATVSVKDGSSPNALCTAVVQGDGSWTCTPPAGSKLSDGDHNITATQSDPSGNTSPASPATKVTVDTVAPGTPTVTTPKVDPATGKAEVNTQTPTLTGTAEPNSTVTVKDPSGTKLCEAKTSSAGQWTCTVSSGTKLPEGDADLQVVATDPAGNASAPKVLPTHVDLTAPDKPVIDKANGTEISGQAEPGSTVSVTVPGVQNPITAVTDKDGNWKISPVPSAVKDGPIKAVATDPAGNKSPEATGYIDTTAPDAPKIEKANADGISGTAEPGSTVTVKVPLDDGTTKTVDVPTDPVTGKWAIEPLPDNAKDGGTISAVATDPAGNESKPATATLDTTPPNAPVVTKPVINPDTGKAEVNSPSPELAGTAEPGSTVSVTDPDGNKVCEGKTDASGKWTCKVPADVKLPEGNQNLEVVATDPAGNPSVPKELPVNVDTQAPAAPVIDKANASGISGTAEPGSTVTVTVPLTDGTVKSIPIKTDPDTGSWSTKLPANAVDGSEVTATATDPAGNDSPKARKILDKTAPDKPVIDKANASGIAGKAEPGSLVTVTVPMKDGSGYKVLPPVKADPVTGAWSVPVPDGAWDLQPPRSVTVIATDAAGNVSDPASHELDITAPTTPTIDKPVINPDTKQAEVNNNKPEFAGTGEPGSTVTVADGNNTICTAKVDVNGDWTCTAAKALSDGKHNVTATAADPAGNVSGQAKLPTNIDTKAPVSPTVTKPPVDKFTGKAEVNTETPELAGISEPNSTVTVSEGGNVLCTAKADVNGKWSCKVPDDMALAEGDHELEVVATDPAGNTSPSVALPTHVDLTAPEPPTFNPTSGGEFSGAGEPGTIIKLVDASNNFPITCKEGVVRVAANGAWLCTPTILQAPGTVISGTLTDPAGNVSEPGEMTVGKLGIRIEHPTRYVADPQTVWGYGFAANEKVTGTIYSTPIVFGTATADSDGTVMFVFNVPNINVGDHTVVLTGEKSGSVKGDFEVIGSNPSNAKAPLGGAQMSSGLTAGSGAALAVICLLSGVAILTWTRRKDQVKA